MISQAPPASPLPLAILALSVVGAIQDFRYRRKGGTPPSKRDRILFGSVLLVIVLAYFVGLSLDYSPAIFGSITPALAIVLFGAWELGRWRMRRKYPLGTAAPPATRSVSPPVKPAESYCTECGHVRDASAKFCGACGKAFV
jgi:hypothetical protein